MGFVKRGSWVADQLQAAPCIGEAGGQRSRDNLGRGDTAGVGKLAAAGISTLIMPWCYTQVMIILVKRITRGQWTVYDILKVGSCHDVQTLQEVLLEARVAKVFCISQVPLFYLFGYIP